MNIIWLLLCSMYGWIVACEVCENNIHNIIKYGIKD